MSDGRLSRGMPGWWQTCEAIEEHQGDSRQETDGNNVVWEKWSCCDTAEQLGEAYDCTWCATVGIGTAAGPPAGWVEDDEGFLCPTHAALAGVQPFGGG